MDNFVNGFLCFLEDLLGKIIGIINDLFGLEIGVPDLGCDE